MPSGAATPGCLTSAPSLNAAATAGPQAQHESRSPATCFGRAALNHLPLPARESLKTHRSPRSGGSGRRMARLGDGEAAG